MKLFEQLKSNASRMAVYAILVATALCGIAAPVYALNGEKGDVEPAYMASTVKDRYKAFSGDTFYVGSCRSEKTVNLLWDARRRGTIAEFVVLVGNQDALCADR